MNYESIEQEVEAENLRKHEREEGAAKREHELKMAKVKAASVPTGACVAMVIMGIVFSSVLTSTAVHVRARTLAAVEFAAEDAYRRGQFHAAGVQAGLSQGRNECKEESE